MAEVSSSIPVYTMVPDDVMGYINMKKREPLLFPLLAHICHLSSLLTTTITRGVCVCVHARTHVIVCGRAYLCVCLISDRPSFWIFFFTAPTFGDISL